MQRDASAILQLISVPHISAALEVATPIIREAQGAAYCGIEPIMSGAGALAGAFVVQNMYQ